MSGYRPTLTSSIGRCPNERYPQSYGRSSNLEYKNFIKQFIDTINDLHKQAYDLKKSNAFSLDMDRSNFESQTINTLLGLNTPTAPQSNPQDFLNRANQIEKINNKIRILKRAVDGSSEHNFNREKQRALDELEVLQNPLARLTQNTM